MRSKAFKFFIFLTAAVFYTGCKEEVNQPAQPVDETNNGFEKFEVAETFASSCALSGCHGSASPQHSLSLTSHQNLMRGSINRPMDSILHQHGKINSFYHDDMAVYGGEAVIPFNSEKSLLYNLIKGNSENPEYRMPYQRTPLSAEKIAVIKEWIDNGAKDFKGNVPFSSPGNKIYVCSQGDDLIYEIDNDYKVVSRIIDVNLNSAALDQPHNIQLYGNYLYVSLISSGNFLKIDRTTRQIIGITSGLQVPGMIVITPDGSRAFVSRSSSAAGIYNTIYVINTAAMEIAGEIVLPVTGLPHAIALTKDGSTLYVANMNRDRISIVDANSLQAVDEVLLSPGPTLEHEPMHIYLSPDDKYLYINCRTSSKMLVMDVNSKQIVSELNIKHHPMQAAISAEGDKIYLVSHHEHFITTVTKTGSTWSVTDEYESPAFQHLYGADLTPDGKYLYVTCSNNSQDAYFIPRYVLHGSDRTALLCVYDTEKKELVKVLDIGKNATGITAR